MPILTREPSVYPAELLSEPSEANNSRQWWAVYTKARQEKALARQLVGYEIPFFLPLISRETMTRGRRTRSHLPLFCGYLFLYGTDEERVQTLTTNRISRILHVVDQDQLFRDLRQVHEVIESGAPLTVESRLEPGQQVRVKHGAFSGMEGKILQRRGGVRLLIAVNYLQQGISIEIDDMMVERI
jgi:transcription antitermination factor NusG